MPRKTFKEMLASVAGVFKAHHDPHEIALGVAIGAFIAILPVYGLHTFLCIVLAFLVPRANKLAILLGTNISLPPTIATITWTAYDIGRLVLPDGHYPPLSWEYVKGLNFTKLGEFYYPLFVGSIVLGIVCAAILYGVTRAIAEYFRKERGRAK